MQIKTKLPEKIKKVFGYISKNTARITATIIAAAILAGVIITVGAAPATTWSSTASTNCVTQGTGNTMVEVNGYIYILAGNSINFRRYDPSTGICDTTSLASFPSTANMGSTLTKIDDNTIFATSGNGTTYTAFYSIPHNQWISGPLAKADDSMTPPAISQYMAANQENGNTIVSVNNDIYMLTGVSTIFAKYTTTSNSWTTLTVAPASAYSGSSLSYPGNGDYIYALLTQTAAGSQNYFVRYSISGNSWSTLTTLANTPAPITAGASMTITNVSGYDYAYVMGGTNNNNFWRYRIGQTPPGMWENLTSIDPMPNLVQAGGALTKNGQYIYALRGNNTNSFWRYDTLGTAGSRWSVLRDTPEQVSGGGSLASDGTYIYATRGRGSMDFWRYNPGTDTWTTLKKTPYGVGPANTTAEGYLTVTRGGITYVANGPSGGGEIYLSTGYGLNTYSNGAVGSLYRYVISNNNWPHYSPAVAPGTMSYGTSVAYPGSGDFLYAIKGIGTKSFWKYMLSQDLWLPWNMGKIDDTNAISQTVYCDGSATCNHIQGNASTFTKAGGKIYAILGDTSRIVSVFDPILNTWQELPQAPVSITSTSGGASIIAYDDNTLYVSGATIGFMKYDIPNKTWYAFNIGKTTNGKPFSQLGPDNGLGSTASTSNQSNGSNIVEFNGKFYIMPGGTTNFYEFNPIINKWTLLAPLPLTASTGSAMVKNDIYIYAIFGNNPTSFYRYYPDYNTWDYDYPSTPTVVTARAALPVICSAGASLASPAGSNFIYATCGRDTSQATKRFYRYNISANTWTSLIGSMLTPDFVGAGGAITAHNSTDLYAMSGNGKTNFWKFTITNSPATGDGTWTNYTSTDPVPYPVWSGGSLTSDGTYIYACVGGLTAKCYQFNPGATAGSRWSALQDAPATIGATGTTAANTARGGIAYSSTLKDIYMITGNGLGSFWQNSGVGPALIFRYQLPGSAGPSGDNNTWPYFSRTQTAPFAIGSGNSLSYPGSGNFIYMFTGGGNNYFLSYNTASNEWHSQYRSKKDDGTALSQINTVAQGAGNSVAEANNIIYVLAGNTTTTFQKFDPVANTWTTLANTPTAIDSGSALVRKDNNTLYAFSGGYSTTFYRYDIPSNTWFGAPIAKKDDGTVFSQAGGSQGIGNRIVKINNPAGQPEFYILPGNGTAFEKYNPVTNTWTSLTATPLAMGNGAMVAAGTDIYVAPGGSTAFWRYSTTTNSWLTSTTTPAITVAPAILYQGAALVYHPTSNNIYVFYGNSSTAVGRYSITNNRWNTAADGPGGIATPAVTPAGINGGSAMIYDGTNTIYALRGGGFTNFYSYSISGNTWTDITTDPVPATVTSGGSLTWNGTYVYATRGNATPYFWRYSPAAAAGSRWTALSNVPGNVGATPSNEARAGIAYCDNCGTGEIYAVTGLGATGTTTTNALIYRYVISSDTWPVHEKTSVVNDTVTQGGSLSYSGIGDIIHAFRGGTTASFWTYDTVGNEWNNYLKAKLDNGKSLRQKGTNQSNGNSIIQVNGKFYTLAGGSTAFEKYDPIANSWTSLMPIPTSVSNGAAMTSTDTDSIYVLVGGATTTFYKYKISTNSWTTLAVVPGSVSYGGAISYPGSGDYLYAFRGTATTTFYKYCFRATITGAATATQCSTNTPANQTNSWSGTNGVTTPAVAPATVGGGGSLIGTTGYIYALGGNNTSNFWTYNIANDRWNNADDRGDPVDPAWLSANAVGSGGSLTTNGSDYIWASKGYGNQDIRRYTISTNTWTTAANTDVTDFPTPMGSVSTTAAMGGLAYIPTGPGGYSEIYGVPGTGITSTNSIGLIFRYKLDPGNICDTNGLNPGSGSSTCNNFRYWPVDWFSNLRGKLEDGRTISQQREVTTGVGGGNSIIQIGGKFYVVLGSTVTFEKYDPVLNTWTKLADIPAATGTGAAMASTDSDTIYLLRGAGTTALYKYTISTNTWSTMGVLLATASYGASLTYPGSGDYLYAFRGTNSNTFYKYCFRSTISGAATTTQCSMDTPADQANSWSGTNSVATPAVAPAVVQGGGSLIGIGGNIYAFGGNNTSNFWRYNIANDRWNNAGDATPADPTDPTWTSAGGVGDGGSLSYDGSDYLYAIKGYGNPDFKRYSISGDSWTTLTAAQFNFGSAGINNTKGGIAYIPIGSSGYPEIFGVTGNGAAGTAGVGLLYRYKIDPNTCDTNGQNIGTSTNPCAGFNIWPTNGLQAVPITVQGGGSMVGFLNGINYDIFALTGNATKTFRAFRIYDTVTGTGSWNIFDPTDITSTNLIQSGGSLTHDGNGNIYAAVGTASGEILRYNLAGNSWTTTAPSGSSLTLPTITNVAQLKHGAALSSEARGGISFVANGAGTSDDELYLVTGNGGAGTAITATVPPRGSIFRYAFGGSFAGTWPLANSITPTAPAIVNSGGSLINAGLYRLFALAGNNTNAFWRFNITDNIWNDAGNGGTPATAPATVGSGGSLTFDGANNIYATRGSPSGVQTTAFWRYNIPNNRWNDVSDGPIPASTPVPVGTTSSGARGGIIYHDVDNTPGTGDETVWMQSGYGRNKIEDTLPSGSSTPSGLLYRYDITTNAWPYLTEALDNPTSGAFNGGSDLTSNTSGTSLFALEANSTTSRLWRYDIAPGLGTWTELQLPPATIQSGGSIIAPENDPYNLYISRGNNTSTIYRYFITGNTWTTPANLDFPTKIGSASETTDSGEMIYEPTSFSLFATPGNDTVAPFTIYKLSIGTRAYPTPYPSNPVFNTDFDVVIEAVDKDGNPVTVTQDTNITLSLKTGTGTLSGTLTGTIQSGLSQVTISGVKYDTYENGVVITATATTGDSLAPTDSAAFSVFPNPPTITNIAPATGGTAGGNEVTITGENYFATPKVFFGGKESPAVRFIDSNHVAAIVPAGNAGTVDVTITNSVTAQSGTSIGGYTYASTVTVTSITPNHGAIGGGTPVTITGTNFGPPEWKRSVSITNGGSALTDYQIAIPIDTATIISQGKMRGDCGDLRVWTADELTLLPYWVEKCNSVTTKIWTKIPSIPAGASTVNLSYGNPTLQSAANGDAVFTFFDDFNTTTIDSTKWIGTWGTNPPDFVQMNGVLRFANKYRLNYNINSVKTFSGDIILEIKHFTNYLSTRSSYGYMIGGFKEDNTTTNNIGYMQGAPSFDYTFVDGAQNSIGTIFPENTQMLIKFAAFGTTVTGSVKNYDTEASIYAPAAITNSILNEKISIGLPYNGTVQMGFDSEWDWVRTRKYTATEPVATVNSETGSNLAVNFDATSATTIRFVNNTTITAHTPDIVDSIATVNVQNADTSTGSLIDGYTYAALALIGISPSIGPTSGNTNATITTSNAAMGGYRRPVTIKNPTSSALTDYQINFILDTATLISGGKMNSNCSDIRFEDSSPAFTAIDNYWLEFGCNTANTSIWVKVPSIPTSGKVIWIKYGNSNLGTLSNIDNVFPAFGNNPIGLWLKADNGTGQTVDGSVVATWADQSGNGNNVSQGTAANQPTYKTNILNGKPAVRFDGTNDYLTRTGFSNLPTGSNPRSVFLMAKNRYLGRGVFGYGTNSPGQSFMLGPDDSYGDYSVQTTTYYYKITGDQISSYGTPTLLHTAILDYNNSSTLLSLKQYRNNTLAQYTEGIPTANLNTNTGFIELGRSLGTTGYTNTDIAEVMVINTNISETDRQEIERYFSIKYGTSGIQPSATAEAATTENGFGTNLAITMGGAYANIFSINNANGNITLSTPAHTAGTVDVSVTNPGTESQTLTNGYTYMGTPTVQSITPPTSTNDVTLPVTIEGTNFVIGAPSPTVKISRPNYADVICAGVTVSSSTSLTCNLPLTGISTGSWNVVVTNPDNQSGILSSGFLTSYAAPDLQSVDPVTGSPLGGKDLTAAGAKFLNFGYIRPVPIDNTSGVTQTDYPIRITIDSLALIGASKMRSDCGDIRVLDSDQLTVLPYYLESGCNTANTVVWAKVPSIPAGSPGKIVYITYGNSILRDQSEGNDVFTFFDDFPNSDIDTNKWTYIGGRYELNPPSWFTTTNTYNGNYSAIANYIEGAAINAYQYRNLVSNSIVIPASETDIIDFYWKTSSTPNVDYLYYCSSNDTTIPGCTSNSSYINRTSGETAWGKEQTTISTNLLMTGTHRIKFSYGRSTSTATPSGTDNAYLDAIKVRKIAYIGSNPITETVTTSVGTEAALIPRIDFCNTGGGLCTPGTSHIFNSTTSIFTLTPAHAPGLVDVKLTNPDGQFDTLLAAYNYANENPTVTSVVPAYSSVLGSDTAIINGTDFLDGATVTFGTTSALSVVFIDNEHLQVTIPPHAAGQVDITVTNPDALSGTKINAFEYINLADDAHTTLSSTPSMIAADGIESSVIRVIMHDSGDLPVKGKVVTLAQTEGAGTSTISAINCQPGDIGIWIPGTSNDSGHACFRVSGAIAADSYQYTATDITDGLPPFTIIANVDMTGPTAANSTVTASPSSVLANGFSYGIITSTLKDASNKTFPNRTVTLSISSGGIAPVIDAINCSTGLTLGSGATATSNSLGLTCYKVTSISTGTYTFQARDNTEGFFTTQTANITFNSGTSWTPNGEAIANAKDDNSTYYSANAKVMNTADGGYVVAWEDDRTSISNSSVYAQKFNSSGVAQWSPSTGVEVYNGATYSNDPMHVDIVPSSNGSIIGWTVGNSLRAARVNSDGTLDSLWTPYKNIATIGSGSELVENNQPYTMVADGANGVFFIYNDRDPGNPSYPSFNTTVSRITSGGVLATGDIETWPKRIGDSGQTCSEAAAETDAYLVRTGVLRLAYMRVDNSGCAFVNHMRNIYVATLNTNTSSEQINGMASTIDATLDGTTDGNQCTFSIPGSYPYRQSMQRIADDGNGGIYLGFYEDCEKNSFIKEGGFYLQHMTSTDSWTLQLRPLNSYTTPITLDLLGAGESSVFVLSKAEIKNQADVILDNSVPHLIKYSDSFNSPLVDWTVNYSGSTGSLEVGPIIADSSNNPIVMWPGSTTFIGTKYDKTSGEPASGWTSLGNTFSNNIPEILRPDKFSPTRMLKSLASYDGGFVVAAGMTNHGFINAPYITDSDNVIQAFNGTGVPQWNSGSYVEISPGVDIENTVEMTQQNHQLVNVGNGNYVYAWEDNARQMNTYYGTYRPLAEKVDSNGTRLWNPSYPGRGIPLIAYDESNATNHAQISISADETAGTTNGGILAAWRKSTATSQQIYLQKLDTNGNIDASWNGSGYGRPFSGQTTSVGQPQIISDTAGGAYITYVSGDNVYIGKARSSDGAIDPAWSTNPRQLTSTANIEENPQIFTLSDGNLVITFEKTVGAYKEIRAYKVNATNGTVMVSDAPIAATSTERFVGLKGITDDSTNLIVTFAEENSDQIRAEKFNSGLARQWNTAAAIGIAVSPVSVTTTNPVIASDNNGGALIAFERHYAALGSGGDTRSDILIQRINPAGQLLWNEKVLTNTAETVFKKNPQIVADVNNSGFPSNGAIVTWEKWNTAGTDKNVYAQHVVNGLTQWTVHGNPITSETTILNENPKLVSDTNGGAILSWQRSASPPDIYGQYYVEGNHSFNSTFEAAPTSGPADNITPIYLTATLLDQDDNPVLDRTITVNIIKGNESTLTITPVSDSTHCPGATPGVTDAAGQACFTVVTSTFGNYTLAATDTTISGNYTVITQSADITFTEAPSAGLSTFASYPNEVPADNASEGYLIARIISHGGNPIQDIPVTVQQVGGTGATITAINNLSDKNGRVEFHVRSGTTGLATFRATIDGTLDITQEAQTSFLTTGSTLSITPEFGPTSGGTNVTITGTNLIKPMWMKSVVIQNNNATALTDYQISFPLDTASLISQNKMQPDCDDLRVVGSNYLTNLPYWFDPAECNKSNTIVWVKVPTIPVYDPEHYFAIAVRYGNTTIPSIDEQKRGEEVFDFFDTFNTNTFETVWDRLTATGPTSVFPGGNTPPYVDTANSRAVLLADDAIQTKYYQGYRPIIIEAKVRAQSPFGPMANLAFRYPPATNALYYGDYTHQIKSDGTTVKICNEVPTCTDYVMGGQSISTDTWYINSMFMYSDLFWASIYNGDGNTLISRSSNISNADYGYGKLVLDTYGTGTLGPQMHADWIRTRQLADLQPTTELIDTEYMQVTFCDLGGCVPLDQVQFTDLSTINAVTPPHAAGFVRVHYSNYPNVVAQKVDAYEYLNPPSIIDIVPSTGINTGTVPVTVNGTNFRSSTTVQLTMTGETPINCSITNVTATTIECDLNLNGGTLGLWDVVVTNQDSQFDTLTDGFLVTGAPPVITDIVPNIGNNNGTTSVTINGSDFSSGATVQITMSGETPINCTSPVITSTTIDCDLNLTGATTGTWNVVVTNPDNQFDSLTGGFTVKFPPPAITGIVPTTGNNNGTTAVTINGTDFRSGATAQITMSGETPIVCTSPVVTSTTIDCNLDLTGATTGAWDVVVTNIDTQFDTFAGEFTVKLPPPFISSVYPPVAFNNGTTAFTINGTEFINGLAAKITKSGETDITCTAPTVTSISIDCSLNLTGASTGLWNVVVTNPDNQFYTLTNGLTVKLPTDAGLSTVIAVPSSVPADNSSTSKITVTLLDSSLTPIVGNNVRLSKTTGPGTPTIDAINCTTNVSLSNIPPSQSISDANGQACFYVRSATKGTDTFTAEDMTLSTIITQTADVQFTCVIGPYEQCLEVAITGGSSGLTLTAPSNFTFGAVGGGQKAYSITDPTYISNINNVVTVSDLRGSSGFNLQMQVNSEGFRDGAGHFLPLQNLYVVTRQTMGAGIEGLNGVGYSGSDILPQNIVAPNHLSNDDGALYVPQAYTTCGSALGTGSTNSTPGTPIPIDLMIGGLPSNEGRNGSFMQNINYYLDIPLDVALGTYNVTFTFDVMDNNVAPTGQTEVCTI